MKPFLSPARAMMALLILLAATVHAAAASLGVRDEAHFFSADAVGQADQVIHQINAKHHRDLLIETIPAIPREMQAQEQSQGRGPFFRQWAASRAREQGVTGVYVLICKNPPHLQAEVGNATAERLFTPNDRDELGRQMLAALKDKQNDQGLLSGVRFVQQQMDAHVPGATGASQYNNNGSGSSAAPPAGPLGSPPSSNAPPRGDTSWGIGSIACVIVAVILGIVLLRGVMGRRPGMTGQPGGYYPPGGGGAYPPAGGYPPASGYGGGYGSGGGSGFGRGFLGGLLGGALGGYATEKWTGQNQPQGGGLTPPAATGGGDAGYNPGPDTSFSSSGGDFGPADSGADSSGGGGGDFGGGSDSGGGGGDFGGGGGGDSGGGGGDF